MRGFITSASHPPLATECPIILSSWRGVSADAADPLLAELMEGVRSLERMPYRNPTYNRPYLTVGKYRYMISGKRYRIIYQIMNDTVFVDDIQDCRQDDAPCLTISHEEEE